MEFGPIFSIAGKSESHLENCHTDDNSVKNTWDFIS